MAVNPATLPLLNDSRPMTVTDQVYQILYERVIDLTLKPGTKLSEAEVASQMGVSRQPVRDAFYRLSQQGFIEIRPQRATVVTAISEASIRQAKFVRTALESACLRCAASALTEDQHLALGNLIVAQEKALNGDRRADFHKLDDQFHHDICAYAGLAYVWALVKENKGHMDRARFLSLAFSASMALAEHLEILAALRARDAERAVLALENHLGRITDIFPRLRADNPAAFVSELADE